jgi:hypothetical protein
MKSRRNSNINFVLIERIRYVEAPRAVMTAAFRDSRLFSVKRGPAFGRLPIRCLEWFACRRNDGRLAYSYLRNWPGGAFHLLAGAAGLVREVDGRHRPIAVLPLQALREPASDSWRHFMTHQESVNIRLHAIVRKPAIYSLIPGTEQSLARVHDSVTNTGAVGRGLGGPFNLGPRWAVALR